MASSKVSKRNAEAAADPSKMNNLERLILVQSVYEFGNNAWPEVSKLLSSHPMLARSKLRFSPPFCQTVYLKLMQDAGLECPQPNQSRKAIVHRQLAKIHYDKRVEEVHTLIKAEEAQFRKIVNEIDEIRAGHWDKKILTDLGRRPPDSPRQETPQHEPQETAEADEGEQEPEIIVIDDMQPSVDHEEPTETAASPKINDDEPENVEDSMQIASPEPAAVDDAEPEPESEPAQEHAPTEEVVVEDVEIAPPDGEDIVEQVNEPEEALEPAADEVVRVQSVARSETAKSESIEDQDVPDQPQSENEAEVAEADTEPQPNPEPEAETEVEVDDGADIEMVVPSDSEQSPRIEGKRKASEALSESVRDRKRPREDSEPVDEDEPSPSTGRGRKKTQTGPDKKFQNVIGMLHSTISQHRYGNIFHNPIKKSEAPDYHDIVKRPMDLKTIKARVKDGMITNSLEFQRDIYLMFANAMMYNRPGSEIHNMAEEMMLESEIHIKAFRQTEGFHRS